MLLSQSRRVARICVLTLDPVLARDVQDRLGDEPRLRDAEVVLPPSAKGAPTVQGLTRLARATTTARVLILDVRSWTLPKLQGVYNRVVGYNRADLNRRCHSILIGDGPASFPDTEAGVEEFRRLLAKFRVDYSPAAFFFDPCIHYGHEQRRTLGRASAAGLPDALPDEVAGLFPDRPVTVSSLRAHLRAAGVAAERRRRVKRKRWDKLADSFLGRYEHARPDRGIDLQAAMSKQGCAVAGETLRVHTYPAHFEEWVADLLG